PFGDALPLCRSASCSGRRHACSCRHASGCGDDEADPVATAKTKRAERRHDDELQQLTHCSSSAHLDCWRYSPRYARPVLGDQLGRRSYRPILPAFAIIAERGGLPGRKAMEWFKQKTSIAGVQVSNWMIVLGAIIIVLLIVQNSH